AIPPLAYLGKARIPSGGMRVLAVHGCIVRSSFLNKRAVLPSKRFRILPPSAISHRVRSDGFTIIVPILRVIAPLRKSWTIALRGRRINCVGGVFQFVTIRCVVLDPIDLPVRVVGELISSEIRRGGSEINRAENCLRVTARNNRSKPRKT